MERGMEAVDSINQAEINLKYLERIDEEHLNGDASARWSIEFCERYNSLDEGLHGLYEDGEIEEVEPSAILTAVDEGQYGEARELLETEYEEDHT